MPTLAESMKPNHLIAVDITLTTSSTRLSENATSNFPWVRLKLADRSSQAKCTRPDTGMMAKKLNVSTISGAMGVTTAAMARGTKTSRRFK